MGSYTRIFISVKGIIVSLMDRHRGISHCKGDSFVDHFSWYEGFDV